ncbi:15-hydroxyprostaglandin dehydrogenase [NAD(+)]-like [Anabrus simplex]|uniref:15-hydroxyprostaglandin dehydrogenase [NAD(+)]-like n=1 Tax=Anabrus simplex TaxID=316456 RepID=UPI0034DCE3AD
MDPQGKVAIITGGASGLGLAFSKILLANGAKVAVCDRNPNTLKEAKEDITKSFGENKAIFIEMDIQDETSFEEAFKKTKSHFNRLDILVNNAGIFDDTNWEREIDINVKGTVRGTLLGFKFLGKDNGGNGGLIVNVSSIAALDYIPFAPIYSATKNAVVALGRGLGQSFHYDRNEVRVITLCPGTTVTPLQIACHKNVIYPVFEQMFKDAMDNGPLGTPEVVAKSFLKMIREAKNGDVWVSEGDETYSVVIPKREAMRKEV